MNAVTHSSNPSSTTDRPFGGASASRTAIERLTLKTVLLANAATSLAAGLVAAFAPGWSAARLGLDGNDAIDWTRIVGIGLAIFAAAILAAAVLLGAARLPRAAVEVTAVDFAWVVSTMVVIATAGLSALGNVIAVVMGVGVLGFAVLQLVLARRPLA